MAASQADIDLFHELLRVATTRALEPSDLESLSGLLERSEDIDLMVMWTRFSMTIPSMKRHHKDKDNGPAANNMTPIHKMMRDRLLRWIKAHSGGGQESNERNKALMDASPYALKPVEVSTHVNEDT